MENSKQNSNESTTWWQPAVNLFGEVTGLMVVPIVAGLYGGRALDAKYSTEPWWFITCSVVGLAIAAFSVTRIAIRYMRAQAKDDSSHISDNKN